MMRFAIVLSALWLACQPVPQPRPPVVDADASLAETRDASVSLAEAAPVVDAKAALVPDTSTSLPSDASVPPCAQACAVLGPRFLGCIEGTATPKDKAAGMTDQESCEAHCLRVEAFPGLTLHPARIALCRDVDCVRRIDKRMCR